VEAGVRVIRVVYVTGEPTPYRTPHLQAIAGRPEIDLHVVYAAKTIQRRTWAVPSDENVTYLGGFSLPTTPILHHDYLVTPRIWPLLDRLEPDCVVVGGWSLMATQLAILWCRAHRVPYLLQSDNHLLEPRAGWVRSLKGIVLPHVVPQAAGWLVPGSLAQEHIEQYGARRDATIVFPLTIDVEAFASRADSLRSERDTIRRGLGFGPDAVVVLQVGRLVRVKAADVVIQAVAAADVPLLLVGDGPEEMRLRSLAETLGASVTFTGLLENDDLIRMYVAADVFVLASRRETWGVVVNEAMAAGLPLVVSNQVGAARDLVVAGRNGDVVPAGDVDALSAALRDLAADAARREAYGRASREAISDWGYEKSVAGFVDLVATVTSRAHEHRRRR
jgi:glycosyltransferase involved in cell wall biosynthesis